MGRGGPRNRVGIEIRSGETWGRDTLKTEIVRWGETKQEAEGYSESRKLQSEAEESSVRDGLQESKWVNQKQTERGGLVIRPVPAHLPIAAKASRESRRTQLLPLRGGREANSCPSQPAPFSRQLSSQCRSGRRYLFGWEENSICSRLASLSCAVLRQEVHCAKASKAQIPPENLPS